MTQQTCSIAFLLDLYRKRDTAYEVTRSKNVHPESKRLLRRNALYDPAVQTRRPTLASGTRSDSVAALGDLLADDDTPGSTAADPSPKGIAAANADDDGADAAAANAEDEDEVDDPLNRRHIRFQ